MFIERAILIVNCLEYLLEGQGIIVDDVKTDSVEHAPVSIILLSPYL